MDFDSMVTPAIYQDIPSSFMMNPMMMPMYGGMPMMYPMYGVGGMRPGLAVDKFESLKAKDKETSKTMKKTGIAVAALAVASWFLSKRLEIKNPELFNKIGTGTKNIFDRTKNICSKGIEKLKNVFKKSNP